MKRAFAKCVRVTAHGGRDVLSYDEYSVPSELAPKQVLLRHSYAGLNFIDTYYRSGLYERTPPFICGEEGAGTVLAVGSEVNESLVGQRVAYFRHASGAYATFGVADADDLLAIPQDVTDRTAAAATLQGMTAHYLVHDCVSIGSTSTVVVHAVAGGTGLLLSQMCVARGATVIGLCRGAAKRETALAVGRAQIVIDTENTTDWVSEVRAAAPAGVDAVFDGVGKSTFLASLQCLRPRGAMVSFGNASGAVDPIAPLLLAQYGSISLQRPTLKHFVLNPGEAQSRFDDVMKLVRDGALTVSVDSEFMLRDAAAAQARLEGRKSIGKVLLNCIE